MFRNIQSFSAPTEPRAWFRSKRNGPTTADPAGICARLENDRRILRSQTTWMDREKPRVHSHTTSTMSHSGGYGVEKARGGESSLVMRVIRYIFLRGAYERRDRLILRDEV